MIAAWALIGGIGGLLRMLAAGALVALVGFFYMTVWAIPAAQQEARKGYVAEQTAKSALALADEYHRQIQSQQIVIDAYQVQYKNQMTKEAERQADDEKAIEERARQQQQNGGPRPGDLMDDGDIEFLRQR